MSESEHSYYEIALTNRQALVAFAVLLAVVLVAFFSGIWVAREGRGELVEVVEVPEPQLGTNPLRPEAQLAEIASAAKADTTLVEDLTGRRPAPPSTRSEPAPTASPQGETAVEEPVSALARAADPEPLDATPEEPAPPVEPAPKPVEPTAPAAAAADGSVVVQILATGDRSKAEGLVKRLEAAGYAAFLSPIGAGSGKTYRVRIGPFATRELALPVQSRVDRQFKVESWITAP